MTLEEAQKLAKVFETVDGGCSVCVRSICTEANLQQFGFIWSVPEKYKGVEVQAGVYVNQEETNE